MVHPECTSTAARELRHAVSPSSKWQGVERKRNRKVDVGRKECAARKRCRGTTWSTIDEWRQGSGGEGGGEGTKQAAHPPRQTSPWVLLPVWRCRVNPSGQIARPHPGAGGRWRGRAGRVVGRQQCGQTARARTSGACWQTAARTDRHTMQRTEHAVCMVLRPGGAHCTFAAAEAEIPAPSR